MSPMAARTRKGALLGGRHRELQKFAQRRCPGVVHGGAHSHLDGLQIQMPRLTATAKDDVQQPVYFARDFPADRFGRFFSWAVGEISSTGRNSQICSLTSNNSSPSSRKRWHSATSRCAFVKLAADENVSVTVLPFTLRVSR